MGPSLRLEEVNGGQWSLHKATPKSPRLKCNFYINQFRFSVRLWWRQKQRRQVNQQYLAEVFSRAGRPRTPVLAGRAEKVLRHLAWQGQTMCADLRSDLGSTTCSDPAVSVLQPSFRLGTPEKGHSFTLLGASFSRTAPVKTAMMNTSPFSLPSVTMCPHCSRCVVAQLACPCSRPCVLHVLS